MVDFSKRLQKAAHNRPVDPIQLYDTLDRASDKGPLRPAQTAILSDWHSNRRDEKDLIVKLHTGQGKTLIGLLMLQARLNEGSGPAVYLCPNNFLASQTCEQARQFGIRVCTATPEVPVEFSSSEAILVTSVQKLFNGLTRFGLDSDSEEAGTVLLDDAHACIDAVRSAVQITLSREQGAYQEIVHLFEEPLKQQGAGTFADIQSGDVGAFLPVPYWAWRDRRDEVVDILARANHAKSKDVKFAWPLIKDEIEECACVISGSHLEIIPHVPPLDRFGTYARAERRVFMSATLANDAFLVQGLGLSPEVVRSPLTYEGERWSGEKMILIPSLIDPSLDRDYVVRRFAKPDAHRSYGVVAVAPSFSKTLVWEKYGATVPQTATIESEVRKVREGKYETTLALANRYDGVDLPDATCRVLVLDSAPQAESLAVQYEESCRPGSESSLIRTAQKIEQGMGRAVRGEKDYCVIVFTGPDLVKSVRLPRARQYLSSQTRDQIEIGMKVAEFAQDEIRDGTDPAEAFASLGQQCLSRDEAWKAYYAEQMDEAQSEDRDDRSLDVFSIEAEAERLYRSGDVAGACQTTQALIDEHVADEFSRGWYLQQIARYLYPRERVESNKMQIIAHKKNTYLLKPSTGMVVESLTAINQSRAVAILAWADGQGTREGLRVAVESLLADIVFGVRAEPFEAALDDLANALGLSSQRPDKEWKEGPDNLWALRAGAYAVIECKSEVLLGRTAINKREAEQMNRSCAWFERHYEGRSAVYLMVHPTHQLESAGAFTHDVSVITKRGLRRLVEKVRAFFAEFSTSEPGSVTELRVQEWLDTHQLDIDNLFRDCFRPPKLQPRS
ncbi:DEAD/DEAH box helicase [Rubricoccus marinus]|uniref:DEAD/DEAH box helicase n=1 Tax=Rubricoccus marinus TaxID=716817 RepID=A0A259TUN0_9BACT|nr:DEAD/DEAH box helicase family protein [Rubricoccus marinus]OZC01465.1 DEAD/DEAH box helicase [Rubricoccus marinus]